MKQRIAIIGAGMAGVAAGQKLSALGHGVTLFEKSRGWGGRCATKRWEGHVVDHGAQYFTIRDEQFRAKVESACGESLLRITAPVLDEKGAELPDSGRWFHLEGNSRLARDLGAGLEVKTGITIEHADDLLRGNGGEFDHVVSTAPVPQTAKMFGVELSHDYMPCLTVLLAYRGEWPGMTLQSYAVSDHAGPLAWSACENHKPGRIAAGHTIMVAQMSEAFSREHLEQPPENYTALVRCMIEERWHIAPDSFVVALGHRWRFARIDTAMRLPVLPAGLHFAGDALTRSRIEDAWLAGAALASRPEFHSSAR